ncbi:MAG: hypothetical protein E3J78_07650, partial [Candidatus Cloacimonadota bacterium]
MIFLFFCLISSFTTERLTFNNEAEWVPSIVVDDASKIHIAYRYPDQIRYITDKTGSWVIDSIMVSASLVSIAVTPAGTPHLAFEASDGDDEIYYATKVGAAWDIDTITNNAISSRCPSIALTPDSIPHIIYYDFEGGLSLRHADKEIGTWSTEVIPGTSIATYSSIAIDNNGGVHVAVVCGTYGGNREIVYANDTSGSWVSTGVTGDALDDDFPSIAVDNNGYAHISYEKDDGADWELWYAENTTGSFVAQQLTNNVGMQDGGYSSIAIDGNGDAHIAYHEDHLVGDLIYLTNRSGSWETDTIFASFSNKTYSWVDRNICIDKLGFVHACFCNQLGGSGSQELYHAVRDEAVGIESPSFYASSDEQCIYLQWSVNLDDACLNSVITRKSHFENGNFIEVARIPHSSSSPTPKTYSYRDKDVNPGMRYYYKLGIMD